MQWRPVEGERYEIQTAGSVNVKIYRRSRAAWKGKRRWVFEVVDRTAGTRRLRSFTDHRTARAEAHRIAEQLASGKARVAEMDNAAAASYGRAVQLLPPGASLELAAATYAKAFALVGDRIVEACNHYKDTAAADVTARTVPEAVAELLAAKTARGKSKRYVGTLKSRLGHFAKKHNGYIGNVSTADAQAYLDGLKAEPSTVRTTRACLYALFRFAEARGYIRKHANPVADVERVETNGDGEVTIYKPEELAALLQHSPKNFLPLVALGAFAGIRTAELGRLHWQDVDIAGGYITVAAGKSKTRSRRLVPVLPNLAAWLRPYSRRRGPIWRGTARELDLARAATAQAAGTPWKANALRHSFISYRLADIQNVAQVSLEAGNSPKLVFRHYRELVKPSAAAAYFAIAPEQPANVATLPTAQEAAL